MELLGTMAMLSFVTAAAHIETAQKLKFSFSPTQ